MKNKEEICNWNILMVQLIGYTAHIMSHTHADRIETCIDDDDDDDDVGLSFIVVI